MNGDKFVHACHNAHAVLYSILLSFSSESNSSHLHLHLELIRNDLTCTAAAQLLPETNKQFPGIDTHPRIDAKLQSSDQCRRSCRPISSRCPCCSCLLGEHIGSGCRKTYPVHTTSARVSIW